MLAWKPAPRRCLAAGQEPVRTLLLTLLLLAAAGCSPSTWLARRIQQAPNTYPRSLGPEPLVFYTFPERWLTNFPTRRADAGPPEARLNIRLVEPADYGFHITSTNWQDGARHRYRFDFRAAVPGPTNGFSAAARGTLFLLHGYGVEQTTMLPWALALAEDGWRCVLVDLRGHGDSTGRKVFFGAVESADLGHVADQLLQDGVIHPPLAVLGASYGASVALKWAGEDTRVQQVVAITPYAELAPAILAIRDRYARWLPRCWVQSAVRKLPGLVGRPADGLDPVIWLKQNPVKALFIATDTDPIAPPAAVQRLREAALPGSGYRHLTNGIHETAPFQFEELLPEVRTWLNHVAE